MEVAHKKQAARSTARGLKDIGTHTRTLFCTSMLFKYCMYFYVQRQRTNISHVFTSRYDGAATPPSLSGSGAANGDVQRPPNGAHRPNRKSNCRRRTFLLRRWSRYIRQCSHSFVMLAMGEARVLPTKRCFIDSSSTLCSCASNL